MKVCTVFTNAAFFSLWGAVLLPLAMSAPAKAGHPCEGKVLGALKELTNEAAHRPALTNMDRLHISRIFMDPGLSREQAAKRAFEIYLQARFRNLDPDIRVFAESALRESPAVKDLGTKGMNAYYIHTRNRIYVGLPQHLHGSAVEFGVRVHELEHAIQTGYLAKRGLPHSSWTTSPRWIPTRYHEEKGAIFREWEFFNSIPDEHRLDLAQEVLMSSFLTQDDKRFLSYALLDSGNSQKTYAKGRHAFTYSYSRLARVYLRSSMATKGFNLIKEDLLRTATYIGGTSAFIAAWYRALVFCEGMETQDVRVREKSRFYRLVCSRLSVEQDSEAPE